MTGSPSVSVDYDAEFFTPTGVYSVGAIAPPAQNCALVYVGIAVIGVTSYREWRTFFGSGGTAQPTIYLQRIVGTTTSEG